MAINPLSVIHRRLYAHRLAGKPLDTPRDAVAWSGAVQAQEFAEAMWSIAQRVRDCADTDVEQAFARGEILRTHVMRPTWHLVAAQDIRWLLELTAPRVHAANRYWYGQAELDADTLARTDAILARALEGGEPLTRKELAAALRDAGIVAEGPRLAYILMHAELEQIACSGPRRGRQHTYALLAQRAPAAVEMVRERALAELALRYFTSHGPATLRDFAWWSGLTVAEAKEGLAASEDRLEREEDGDGTRWFAAGGSAANPTVGYALLLPMYDESIVAYKDLRVVLAEPPPRDGLLSRAIVIGGRTVGSWKRTLAKREVVIEATLFTSLGARDSRALASAVAAFGRSLGLPARLEAHDARGSAAAS